MVLHEARLFTGLLLKVIWLDMLTNLFCAVCFTVTANVADDYLKGATQRGLDYSRFLTLEIQKLC